MSQMTTVADKIASIFSSYCEAKGYQKKLSEEPSGNGLCLEVSNLVDRVKINIYYTGKIYIAGKTSDFKSDLEKFKDDFEKDPKSAVVKSLSSNKPCAATYDILEYDVKDIIKKSLEDLGDTCDIIEKPNPNIDYKAKISRNSASITLVQYNTGKLTLQGKTNDLFDDCCTHIERLAAPNGKEVIARFISGDERSLEYFAAKYTPRLLELSEEKVKQNLGKAFDYLEPYDRGLIIASECMSSIKLPLYEYSPIVMPASKAFEGFARKLLTDIGLFDPGYFETKGSNFGALNNSREPRRIAICDKDKYAESFLKRLSVAIEFNRHFMLHSDSKSVTKVNSQKDGETKLEAICRDTREIFQYFDDLYSLI